MNPINQKKLFLLCISVLLSVPYGLQATFKASQFIPQYNSTQEIVSADFTGNGQDDLFVVSYEHYPRLYTSEYGGILKPAQQKFGPKTARNVELIDINNDGKMDIWLGINERSSQGQDYEDEVYINKGGGNIELAFKIPTGEAEPSVTLQIVSFDIDSDGYTDIIRTLYNRTFIVYKNLQGNGFEEIGKYTGFYSDRSFLTSIEAGDLDGDGHTDLVMVFSCSAEVFYGNGSSDLSSYESQFLNINTSACTRGIEIVDSDNDGDLDIHLLPSYRYINKGNREYELSYACPVEERTGRYGCSVIGSGGSLLFDYDGDNDLDLWSTSNNRVVLTNELGKYDFDNIIQISPGFNGNFHSKADLDGNGLFDLVSYSEMKVYLQDSLNEFTYKQSIEAEIDIDYPLSFQLLDVNNDGNIDIVAEQSNYAFYMLGDGYGNFDEKEVIGQDIGRFDALDFNSDGKTDYFMANSDGTNVLKYGTNDSNFTEVPLPISTDLDPIINIKKFNDFNNDGLMDFISVNYPKDQKSNSMIEVFKNNGNDVFENIQILERRAYPFVVIDLVDINGDGVKELLYYYEETDICFRGCGKIDILKFEGSQFQVIDTIIDDFTFPYNQIFPGDYSFVENAHFNLIDWDLDGDLDILSGRDYSSQATEREISIQHEGVFTTQTVTFPYGQIKDIKDYNNDGIKDFLIFDDGGDANKTQINKLYIQLNKGNGDLGEKLELLSGTKVRRAKSADIDNDGDLDVVVTNSNLGIFVYLNKHVNHDYSGLWINPDQLGHGIQIERLEIFGKEQLFGAWYIFDEGKPIWLVAQGEVENGNGTVPINIRTGGIFGSHGIQESIESQDWGEIDFNFSDSNTLDVAWRKAGDPQSDGSMRLKRLTAIGTTGLDISGIKSCNSGTWFDPENNSNGIMIQVLDPVESPRMLMTWYTYFEGEQYWIVAQGDIIRNKAVMKAQIVENSEGFFPPTFDSSSAVLKDWGTVTFELYPVGAAIISWESVLPGFESGRLLVIPLTSPLGNKCTK